jgi:hypothetical protein
MVVSHLRLEGWVVVREIPLSNAHLAMLREDGHFVVYTRDGTVIDSPGAETPPVGAVTNPVLRVQNDGNVVLYDNAGVPPRNAPWATNTFMQRSGDCRRLNPNQVIYPLEGTPLTSCNGTFSLVMTADGSLAVRDPIGALVIQPLAPGGAGAITLMQQDGNLVIYDIDDGPSDASDTFGQIGAYAALEDDGSFIVYDVNDVRLWPPLPPSTP